MLPLTHSFIAINSYILRMHPALSSHSLISTLHAEMNEPARTHLPACTSISVVGEIRRDPVVDVAQGHPPPLAAVDGECDEGCVRVGRFGVVVAVGLRLQWIQSRCQVDGARWRLARLRAPASRARRLARCSHFAVLPDVESRQPVHGSETAV